MNQRAYFVAFILCTASFASFARAPVGSDDFTPPPDNWGPGPPAVLNYGQLTEANQRLEYTTQGNNHSQTDFAQWSWNSYTDTPASWTFQIDINLPDLNLDPAQYVLFGLKLNDQRDPEHVFSFGYNSFAGASFAVAHEFTAVTPNGTFSRQCSATTPCAGLTEIGELTALRLRFDATSNTLFTDFDANGPNGGYTWVNLSSTPNFIPDTIFVFGQSSNRSVTSADNVYGANVSTTTVVVPEPSTYAMLGLGIGLVGWLARGSRKLVPSRSGVLIMR